MTTPGRRQRKTQAPHVPPGAVLYDTSAFTRPEDALRAAARAQGCTCNPDIQLGPPPHAQVFHDDWCPLLRKADVN